MSKIKPLGDKILVRALESEEKTKSGIILPDSAKVKPQVFEVIEIGSGKIVDGKKIPLDVKVGDRVAFESYHGHDIKIEGDEYKLIKEEDILAIIQD